VTADEVEKEEADSYCGQLSEIIDLSGFDLAKVGVIDSPALARAVHRLFEEAKELG
jgi:hypothetical protein